MACVRHDAAVDERTWYRAGYGNPGKLSRRPHRRIRAIRSRLVHLPAALSLEACRFQREILNEEAGQTRRGCVSSRFGRPKKAGSGLRRPCLRLILNFVPEAINLTTFSLDAQMRKKAQQARFSAVRPARTIIGLVLSDRSMILSAQTQAHVMLATRA